MSTRIRRPLKRQQTQLNVEDADSKKRRIAKKHIRDEQPDEQKIAEKKDRKPSRRRNDTTAAKASEERVGGEIKKEEKAPGNRKRRGFLEEEAESLKVKSSRTKPVEEPAPKVAPKAEKTSKRSKKAVKDTSTKAETESKETKAKTKKEVESKKPEPSPSKARSQNSDNIEQRTEISASGRIRRASRRSAPVKLVDSENESEEDFSDNDDEDFVLSNGDTSDDEKIVDEFPEYEDRLVIVENDRPPRRTDKIKKFLDEIEEPAFVKNNIKIEPVAGSGSLKLNVAASKHVKQKPKQSRAKKAPDVKKETVSDGDDSVAKTANRNSKTKSAPKAKIKRSASLADESDDSITVTKVKPAKRVKKVIPKIEKKTFTKPRKPLKVKEEKTEIRSSRVEMRLLQLAKQMDNSDDSEDEELDSSEQPEVKTEGETTSVKAKLKDEADKKLLIMSMLKEHEDVDEMSDDSSDDDLEKAPAADVRSEKLDKSAARTRKTEKTELATPRAKATGKKTEKTKKSTSKSSKKKPSKKGAADVINDESSDSDEDNWEVVDDAAVRDPEYKRPENVTVVLKNEDFIPEAKRLTMEQRMISLINRKRKSSYLLCHRVHLLALVGHHRVLNSILNDDFVKASALSRLPPSIAVGKEVQKDSQVIRQILLFYKSAFELKVSDGVFIPKLLKANLIKLLMKKVTSCNIVYLFGLLALLRAGGIRSRLCLSYHLLPHRAPLLRIKDGQIVELGSKSKLSDTDAGIADYFVEVHLSDGKRRWRPLDIDEFKIIEDPHELTPHLEQPVAFLIGIDADGCMTDLSPKYNADWLNKIKLLRSDPAFFEQVLAPFAPEEKEQAEEQQEAASRHEQHGIPKVISEFKNHPKYALSRHLLKFEAFYPREPPILGYVRNEPVYPREAVHTLRSKDTWHRQARQVKEGEVPYSIVKARPKWNKHTESFMRDLPLEVYGEWQTEPYKPPVAENGIIPRNKFGNVELFHPDMLPIGTVHLKLAGLQRIADELEVDCVPAVIGFDGVGRGCHPVIEGFVVCVENKEILEDAWNERQVEDRHKRRERIRKRAVKNWKKLIKKIIWDLRLKKKYKNKLEQE